MGLFDKKHSVGKTIATLRKEKGWTQVELAEKLQVSDKAVSKWEKDDAFPSIEFFPVLAELFGVSIDYLMTGKAPEKEIVVMSKAELCAKTDDPSLLSDINVTNRIECYIASADEIRVAKLKKDDTVGADELAIQSALHCGVLCIDEILATNDYKLIKKAIETYPVTTYELQGAVIESAIEYLSNNNWRDLFE